MLGDGFPQPAVALLRAIAVKALGCAHLVDGGLHRLAASEGQGLGDIADAQTDQSRIRGRLAEGLDPPCNLGEKVSGLEFEVVAVDLNHGITRCLARHPATRPAAPYDAVGPYDGIRPAGHDRRVPEISRSISTCLVNAGINRPARYMGHELGVEPRIGHAARVRWALTYPEIYEVGSSNLGHIILYSILNAVPGQLCDRAYLPAADLAERLRERQQPLFAVESRRPLPAFDILGFSLSYELGATNILEMLDLAQVPIRAADRGDLPLSDPAAPPLIFAGGPTATSNPEPYAAFFDFIALGDGEELLPEIGLVVAEAKADGWSVQLLRDLAQVPGVYVPSLYAPGADGVTLEPLHPELPSRALCGGWRLRCPTTRWVWCPMWRRCMTDSRWRFDAVVPVGAVFASPACSPGLLAMLSPRR